MRHFVKTAGICLLLVHGPVQALGMGGIRVKSTLNQRFNADILLSLNTGDNPGDIHVQLAPYDKFSERAIPWDRELLKLRFEPVQNNANSVLIRVKSIGVILEPVLVFLVQASSQKGTVYRQFTVLLDPPANYEPVRIRRHVEPDITLARQHHEPRSGFYTPPQQRRAPAPVPMRIRPFKPAPDIKRKPDWVVVKNNDSVSKIAKRLNASVNYEQMAIALFNANPNAFFSPNINALKAGETLRVPDRKTLNSLSASAARAEFYQQNRDWKDHVVTPLPPPLPELKAEPVVVAEASVPVQKKLTLSAPADVQLDLNALLLGDEINAAIKPPLLRMGALSEQVQGLQERLNKMEQQMASMQKLLLVKDEQLALLQNQHINDAETDVLPSWLSHFLMTAIPYLKIDNRNLLYVGVGLVQLIALGLLSFYGNKRFKAKKARKVTSNRY
jgi:pilus assembly protein FimV